MSNQSGADAPSDLIDNRPASMALLSPAVTTNAQKAGFNVPGRFELLRSGEGLEAVVSLLGVNAIACNEDWSAVLVGRGQVWFTNRGAFSVDAPEDWECAHNGRQVAREIAREELYLRELLTSKLATLHGYFVNLDERGGFSADVRDAQGKSLFEVRLGNELDEGESSLVDDGFMRHGHDLDGLMSHLTALGVLAAGAQLLPQGDFERAVERFITDNRLSFEAPAFPRGPITMEAVRAAQADRASGGQGESERPRMRA